MLYFVCIDSNYENTFLPYRSPGKQALTMQNYIIHTFFRITKTRKKIPLLRFVCLILPHTQLITPPYVKYNIMRTERFSNFELLRLFSIFLIQTMHIIGPIHNHPDMSFMNIQIESLVNIIGNTGVTCFVLLSGWFGIKRDIGKFFNLLIVSIVYSMLTAACLSGGDIKSILMSAWGILCYKNWFIGCYFVLMFIAPWLNESVDKGDRDSIRKLLATLIIAIGLIQTLTHAPNGSVVFWHGKCIAWIVTLYLTGRYLRRYHPDGPSTATAAKMMLTPMGFLFLFRFSVSLLPARFSGLRDYLSGDSSPLIMLEAIGIFYMFKSLNIKSGTINYMAKSVFPIYLMGGAIALLDKHIYHISDNSGSMMLSLLIVADAATIMLAATVIDKTYYLLFGTLQQRMVMQMTRLYEKAKTLTAPLIRKF